MIDLEILKKQNSLTTNDDGLIYVKPFDDGSWQTYPLDDLEGCLALTPEEYILLKANYYRINSNLTELEINEIVNGTQYVYVKPTNEYNFEIDKEHRFEDSLELTIEQLIKLKNKEYKFNSELNGIEINELKE